MIIGSIAAACPTTTAPQPQVGQQPASACATTANKAAAPAASSFRRWSIMVFPSKWPLAVGRVQLSQRRGPGPPQPPPTKGWITIGGAGGWLSAGSGSDDVPHER